MHWARDTYTEGLLSWAVRILFTITKGKSRPERFWVKEKKTVHALSLAKSGLLYAYLRSHVQCRHPNLLVGGP